MFKRSKCTNLPSNNVKCEGFIKCNWKNQLLVKGSEVVDILSIEYNYELNLETRYEEGIEKGAEEQARTTSANSKIKMYI